MSKAVMSYVSLRKSVAQEFAALEGEVRHALLTRYWNVGKLLCEAIGDKRGTHEARELVLRLADDFDRKDASDFYKMMQFYEAYSEPPDTTLTWTHYKELVTIHDARVRKKYERIAVKETLPAKVLAARIRGERKKVQSSESGVQSEVIAADVPVLSFQRGELYWYGFRSVRSSGFIVPSGNQSENFELDTQNWLLDLGFGLEHRFPAKEGLSRDRYLVRCVKNDDAYTLKYHDSHYEKRYTYVAEVLRVIDADTLELRVDLGFDMSKCITARLKGIDAPERNTNEGRLATDFVKKQLSHCSFVIVKTHKSGKYGRWLADIFYDSDTSDPTVVAKSGVYLNQELLDCRYASLYNA